MGVYFKTAFPPTSLVLPSEQNTQPCSGLWMLDRVPVGGPCLHPLLSSKLTGSGAHCRQGGPEGAGGLLRIPHWKPKPLPSVSKTSQLSNSARSRESFALTQFPCPVVPATAAQPPARSRHGGAKSPRGSSAWKARGLADLGLTSEAVREHKQPSHTDFYTYTCTDLRLQL